MKKLDFNLFSKPVDAKFIELASKSGTVLVRSSISGDALYEFYLDAYPAEFNGIFRERREYDGNFDKNYIRRLGNVVAINADGTLDTIWNVSTKDYFQDVAKAMHEKVLSYDLTKPFLTDEPVAGHLPNIDSHSQITWTHFYSRIPSNYYIKKDLAKIRGEIETTISVFERGLETFTRDATDRLLELLVSNSIYRASEFLKPIKAFSQYKEKYDSLKTPALKRQFVLHTAILKGQNVRLRNTVIGTLLEDLSNDVDLEKAVAAYEHKVAPANYRRSTALVTPVMIKQAKEKLEEEGLYDSLQRRFATIEDININDVLFASQKVVALDVFDELSEEASRKQKATTLKKLEQISIEDFLSKVVPTAKKIEAVITPSQEANRMTLLTADIASAPTLFNWDNHFSWSYKGNVTDAIQERVKKFGGSLQGDLRVSLSWYNPDDLDLSIIEPSGFEIKFSNKRSPKTGGTLDLDMNGIDKKSETEPVENIIYPSKNSMTKGVYNVVVNQFSRRSTNNVGFALQVEANGVVTNYTYNLPYNSRQTFLQIEFDGESFKIKNCSQQLVETGGSPTEGGLKVNELVPVNFIMNSPNFWGDNKVGNKHYFFILEGCSLTEDVRGFYNEFLKPELNPHRKALELLGNRLALKVTPEVVEKQLAGLGFSSTVRNKLVVRVTGKTVRNFEILF